MQECEVVPCFGNVGAVAGVDWVAVAENGVSVTERVAEETEIEDGLEQGTDGELGEPDFGIAKDV